jgi:uncharacterized protein (TIGR02145 family)
LYNWDAVNKGKLCPIGWRVPTDDDWKTLEMTVGMTQEQANQNGWRGTDQGKKLKSEDGWSIGKGLNSVGFNVIPAGWRTDTEEFHHMGDHAYFWTATDGGGSEGICRYIWHIMDNVYRNPMEKKYGFSVRCVKE